MDMFIYLILLFYITQNASPVPHIKDIQLHIGNDIQLKNNNLHGVEIHEKPPKNLKEDSTDLSSESRRFFNLLKNKHDRDIQLRSKKPHGMKIHKKPLRNLKEDSIDLSSESRRFFNWLRNNHDEPEEPAGNLFLEDSLDLSNESRRYFDGVKRILKKMDFKWKTPSHSQVLGENLRFKRIEANLTEILTKLSHVLTEILHTIKHVSHCNIKQTDLHDKHSHRTNIQKSDHYENKYYYRSKRDVRLERDLNKDDIVHTKINIDNVQESIKNKVSNGAIDILSKIGSGAMNYPNQTEIELNTSGNVVDKEDENKNLSVTKITTQVSDRKQNNQDSLTKQPVNDSKDDATTKVESHKLNKRNNQNENIQEKRVKRHAADLKKAVTEKPQKLEVDKVEVKQNVSEKNEVTDTSSDAEIAKTGRRSMPQTEATHGEVKNRLFKYIDEAFSDIGKKVDYLKQIKQIFFNDASYQIGYIVSNIDTLDVNMRNMKRDMERNKYIWDDEKILNLYDTVKVSNQAIADLLEILKSYIEKSSNLDVSPYNK